MRERRPFSWAETCAYIISMGAPGRALHDALAGLRPHRLTVWPGVNVTRERLALEETRGLVPADYATDTGSDAYERYTHGISGNALSHMSLLDHARHERGCAFVAVFEDDVALLPGFGPWSSSLMRSVPDADYVNLCAVRAFGAPVNGSSALRLTASLPYPQRAPNILMVAYIARRASLGRLLDALRHVDGWRRHCTIDQARGDALAMRGAARALTCICGRAQVVPRVLYALGATYPSYHVAGFAGFETTLSRVAHCGDKVYTEATRHEVCAAAVPSYGKPSRSRQDPRTRKVLEREAGGGCTHAFRVPGERLSAAAVAALAMSTARPTSVHLWAGAESGVRAGAHAGGGQRKLLPSIARGPRSVASARARTKDPTGRARR